MLFLFPSLSRNILSAHNRCRSYRRISFILFNKIRSGNIREKRETIQSHIFIDDADNCEFDNFVTDLNKLALWINKLLVNDIFRQ